MEDMEVDMDHDEEVDQERRRRAAQKIGKRTEPNGPRGQPSESTMNLAQALDMFRKLVDLFNGNKITANNAFDLQGIDALRVLVFREEARGRKEFGEGHFQNAGIGLEIGFHIFSKRVDAVKRLAVQTLGGDEQQGDRDQEDGNADPQLTGAKDGADGQEEEVGEDGAPIGPRGGKGKKRQAVEASATLVKDEALRQPVKERTFDTDPFFVRTSRLIDENSPQGLLLHNLMVLGSGGIAFDPSARPLEVPLVTETAGDMPGLDTGALLLDLTVLPGARELLAAVSSQPSAARISPGIEELYNLLEDPGEEMPGLQVAGQVDPQEMLRRALAENQRERVEARRNAVVRQVVQQVEDAMDVDMADADDDHQPADGAGQDHGGLGQGEEDGPDYGDAGGGAFHDDEDGGGGFGVGPSGSDGYGSPGCNGLGDPAGSGREGSDDEFGRDSERGQGGGSDGEDGRNPSDDESSMFSLLSSFAATSLGGPGTSQASWWKSRSKKKPPARGTAAAKTRRQKPEEVPLDWRAELEPQLEDAALHVFKTTRREATAKILLPPEEPARPEDQRAFFSTAPLSLLAQGPSLSASTCGFGLLAGAGATGGVFDLEEAWRAVLMADRARDRQMRREQRAAAAAAARGVGATPIGRAPAAGGPTMSGTGPVASDTDGAVDGAGYGGDEGYDGGGGFGGGDGDCGDDDAGAAGLGGGLSDEDDDEEDGEQPLYGGGRDPTLEELLQPPRRVQRTTIKFDRTAGVADVASLKSTMEQSLKHLTVNPKPDEAQQTPEDATPPESLSFQSVLDQVSAQAAEQVASQRPENPKDRGGAAAGGLVGRSLDPLAGVSTHLAFICLLHLANEKGLALSNGGNLNMLRISGLHNLAREGMVGR